MLHYGADRRVVSRWEANDGQLVQLRQIILPRVSSDPIAPIRRPLIGLTVRAGRGTSFDSASAVSVGLRSKRRRVDARSRNQMSC